MKIIKPSVQIMTLLNQAEVLEHLERCGRTCYKSEDRITDGSAEKFVRGIIRRGHESVLEHFSFTVRFICDRGVTHEIIRHRLASFSQESTRYCAYKDDVEVILPCYLTEGAELAEVNADRIGGYDPSDAEMRYWVWYDACSAAEDAYHTMLEFGAKPEEARAVLPNSLKSIFLLVLFSLTIAGLNSGQMSAMTFSVLFVLGLKASFSSISSIVTTI